MLALWLQVAAAQLCYAVAGTPLQWWDPASRLCLLGADHRRAPHSARSVAAFQRTEIYDWAMTAGRLLNPGFCHPTLPPKPLVLKPKP